MLATSFLCIFSPRNIIARMEMEMGFMALIRDAREASRRFVPMTWQPMETKYPRAPTIRIYFRSSFFTFILVPRSFKSTVSAATETTYRMRSSINGAMTSRANLLTT